MLETIVFGVESHIVLNQHPVVRESDLVPLISRVAQGDEDALREIYEETRSQVYGLAFSILRDRGDADEATLTVFTRVWRNGFVSQLRFASQNEPGDSRCPPLAVSAGPWCTVRRPPSVRCSRRDFDTIDP